MIDVDELIEDLAGYYTELGCNSYIKRNFKDFTPDLRVQWGKNSPLVFKVHSIILDREEVREEWVTYDETYREWWLCVPEELQEAVEDMIEELELENVTLCYWDENDGEIYFYDIPDPEDN